MGVRARRFSEFDAHEWGVLLPLALVGFFTNYDTGLLTLAAPAIADGLDVSVATFGIGVAIIRLSALGSVGTLRLADRWGRRKALLLSVLGFTIATGLTALAWGLFAFIAFQLVARLFLATEETLAGVVITEELRPDRRGAGIGMLGIISMSGFGLVAGLLMLSDATPLGWRLFYVVALVPLVVVAYLRRNLKETRAFDSCVEGERVQPTWLPKLSGEDRSRLWRIAVLHGFVGMVGTTAFFYASELAQDDYGWKGLFTIIVVATAPAALIGFVAGGRLSDRFGRKPVLIWSMVLAGAGVVLTFTELRWAYAPGFFLMAGADSAVQSVRTTYVSELFPTEVRATLASFVNAVAVAAGSIGLVAVGLLAGVIDPSTSIIVLALGSAATIVLLRRLPETAGIDVINAPEVEVVTSAAGQHEALVARSGDGVAPLRVHGEPR